MNKYRYQDRGSMRRCFILVRLSAYALLAGFSRSALMKAFWAGKAEGLAGHEWGLPGKSLEREEGAA